MADPTPLIPEWLFRIAEHVLGGIGFVTAGISGLLYRNYKAHIAMLLRHEKWINGSEAEFGQNRSHREAANKGPVGEALNARLLELKHEDELLHRRIADRKREQEKTNESVVEIKNDIKWIRQILERMEKE